MKCPNCDIETDQDICPECGTTILSVADATIDALVAQASIPNLAALFKQGQQAGLIKPSQDYA